MNDPDVIVIGGGFYGCETALALEARGLDCLLLEREPEILRRASFANQARIHGGYHYPRSVDTGLRSRASYRRFIDAYRHAIVDGFVKLYAVARTGSHVSAAQFEGFCRRIGAPLRPPAEEHARLFDSRSIERAWQVEECAFDAVALRDGISQRLAASRVGVQLSAEVSRISRDGDRLLVEWQSGEHTVSARARHVFLCAYGFTNRILRRSELPLLGLRFEMAELAVVAPPPALEALGITVMCGPFFSVMPHPGVRAHSLSHVRYTPHASWSEDEIGEEGDPMTAPRRSRFESMRRDAERYVPAVGDLRQISSLWEAKALLPRNDADDGRPILLVRDHGLPGLHCVLGGKIDNVFDVLERMDAVLPELRR